MGTDDCVANPACWVESKPCKCGAQNWIATHVERVAIKFGGGKGWFNYVLKGFQWVYCNRSENRPDDI